MMWRRPQTPGMVWAALNRDGIFREGTGNFAFSSINNLVLLSILLLVSWRGETWKFPCPHYSRLKVCPANEVRPSRSQSTRSFSTRRLTLVLNVRHYYINSRSCFPLCLASTRRTVVMLHLDTSSAFIMTSRKCLGLPSWRHYWDSVRTDVSLSIEQRCQPYKSDDSSPSFSSIILYIYII